MPVNKPVNKNELTKEQMIKAMKCKNADELIELADTEGIALTKDEAEAYVAELADFEINEENLKKIAGGACYMANDPNYCNTWCEWDH